MRPDDLEQLREDLINFHAELENPGVRAGLVEASLPRLLGTLEMIPEELRGGQVLELGSAPYFLSLCLRRLCSGRVVHGNYFGTEGAHGLDRLVHARTGEAIAFEHDLFNIEADDFPYPDASFDVVVFSELIEHLGLNPVRTLSEIHRVLKPSGAVIITTPNSLSLERLSTYLRAGSQMVDRYSPLFGYGARHNREYHPRELRELLEGCGFAIEALTLRDLAPLGRCERWQRALWRRLAALYSDAPREEHIFLRARRGARFRWAFPPSLFDNIQFYTLVRYPWMEMGINDAIQSAAGWHGLEPRREVDGDMRWIVESGQAFLKTPAAVPHTVRIDLYAASAPGAPDPSVHLTVWDRWLRRMLDCSVYVDASAPVARGRWQQLEFPLGEFRPRPGDEVEVRVDLEPADLGRHPALAGLPERERGIAVHRVEYVSGTETA